MDSYSLDAAFDPAGMDVSDTWHHDVDRDGRLSSDEPAIQASEAGSCVAGPF